MDQDGTLTPVLPSGYQAFTGYSQNRRQGAVLIHSPDAEAPTELGERPGRMILPEIPPAPFTIFPLEILARGNHFVVKIRGKTVADCWDDKGTYKKGRIALQPEIAGTIVFKRIEIKELPPEESGFIPLFNSCFVRALLDAP